VSDKHGEEAQHVRAAHRPRYDHPYHPHHYCYHPHHCCSAPAVCGGPPGGVHPERVGGAAPVHAGTLLQPDPGHHVVRFQFQV